MINQDYDNLLNSTYTREQLCWIILTSLDTINKLNEENERIDEVLGDD